MPRWWFQAGENYFCLGHLNSLIIIFLYKCPFMVFNENENAKEKIFNLVLDCYCAAGSLFGAELLQDPKFDQFGLF